jgi:hypothetical protein
MSREMLETQVMTIYDSREDDLGTATFVKSPIIAKSVDISA